MNDLELPRDGVDFGVAFPLTVTRRFELGHEPPPFDPRELAPLRVTLVGSDRSAAAGTTTETLRFEARAFALDHIELGGQKLTVRPSVNAAAPGRPELPCNLFELPHSAWSRPAVIGLAGFAMLVALLFVAWNARRRRLARGAARNSNASDEARTRAQRRFAELRATPLAVRDAAFATSASDLVRDFLFEQATIRAPWRTREQLLADHRFLERWSAAERAPLADFLARCDQRRFGDPASAPPIDDTPLAAVAAFLERAS